jgi:electron transfer flavoprotein beta subunit
MRLVVCVNPVFDITRDFKISMDSSRISSENYILNPWDEFAIEAALQVKETLGTDVIALSAGSPSFDLALRAALAMGCDQAYRIDLEPLGISGLQISKFLAAAIHQFQDIGLAFFGNQSIDFENGITAYQTGSILGWPVFNRVSSIQDIDTHQIMIHRSTHLGIEEISAPLPAVVTINKNFAEPRFPSFMGTRKAAKAVINTLDTNQIRISESPPKPNYFYERRNRPETANEMLNTSSPVEMVEQLMLKLKAVGL